MSEPTLDTRLRNHGSELIRHVREADKDMGIAAARIAELEADANLFVLLHAFAIEKGYMPGPGESAYDLLQRAIMTNSPAHAKVRIAELEAANAICRRDIEALMTSCDRLEARNTELEAERDQWQALAHLRGDHSVERAKTAIARIAELEAERDTSRSYVDRVWRALGISTHEAAGGKAIDEIVSDLLAERDRLITESEECKNEIANLTAEWKAQRDRLKAALIDISVVHPSINNIMWVIERARAALSDPSGE